MSEPVDEVPILAESDPQQGRVGYGGLARYTPLIFGLTLLAVVIGIGISQLRSDESDQPPVPAIVGTNAYPFELTLLNGSTISLADLAGKQVALNFWGSWCAPCEEEMPVFEQVYQIHGGQDGDVVILGVGIKQDNDANARALVEQLALTYPIGRDTAGSDDLKGPIESAFKIANYPSTVFIGPDGVITGMHVGEMTADQIEAELAKVSG